MVTDSRRAVTRPSVPELDAISLVVAKYSATEIIFHFGNWYTKVGMARYHYRLAAGDHVTVAVTVKGTSLSTTETYVAALLRRHDHGRAPAPGSCRGVREA
jgi:hypothetical protein